MADSGSGPVFGPLRGRDHEIATLHGRVRGVAEGEGGVVAVEGPAGTGKTRLLMDAVVVATTIGVATAVASAAEQDVLGTFGGLARAMGEPIGAPPPGAADARFWFVEQLRGIVESSVARAPLLLAIDDLGLADTGTLETIKSLVRELDTYPLLWLLAGDRTDRGAPLDRLFAALQKGGAARLQLGALSLVAVASVISDIAGAEPDHEFLDLAEGAGGNPGLLVELTEGLQDESAIEVRAGVAHLASEALPRRVRVIVADRLGRLSAEVRRMLAVAAALGRTFSADEVADVLDEPVGRLLATLQEAQDASVLIPTAGALGFRHELVRIAVYESTAESIRVALHRQIGAVLLRRGGSAVAAARHLVEGARRGDQEMLAVLDEASRELMKSAPESAADLAVRALELCEPLAGLRYPRIVAAVDTLMAARRVAEAAALVRSTLGTQQPPPDAAAKLQLTLSSIEFMGDRAKASVAAADEVLSVANLDDELYAAAELMRLMALMAGGDFSRARRPAEAILAGGGRSRSDASLAGALTVMGSIAWGEARVVQSISFFRAAVRRSEEAEARRHVHPRQSLAVVLSATGEFEEAEDVLRQDRREIEQLGDSGWIASVVIRQASLHLARGRIVDAEAEAEAGIALAEELGSALFIPLARSTLAATAMLRGDLTSAAQGVLALRGAPPRHPAPLISALAAWCESRLAYALYGPVEAVEVLAGVYASPALYTRLFLEEPAFAPWLVRTALAAGDRQRAEPVVSRAEALAAANRDVASLTAAAIHTRALFDGDGRALDAAVAGHRHPWARTSALEDSAVALVVRDRQAAAERFARALADYEDMGADGEAARIRGRLRELSVRRPRTPRPSTGWEGLTETERRISRLTAQGLTNAQAGERMFLSRHTVDFHLRQIFRKLNVRSRVELTRIAVEEDRNKL